MTLALDWASPRAAVASALSGLTGVDAAIGAGYYGGLGASGAFYDARYAAQPGVDTAKVAWVASATDVWVAANHALLYAEGIIAALPGGPVAGPSLSFDAYRPAPLQTRLATAIKWATTFGLAPLTAQLVAYQSFLVNAFQLGGPGAYFAPWTRTAAYVESRYVPGSNPPRFTPPVPPHVVVLDNAGHDGGIPSKSVRQLEADLIATIDASAQWIVIATS